MTDWEIHDVAVQMVRDALIQRGYNVYSWLGHPNVKPSIWFVGDSSYQEWIVVKGLRFPQTTSDRPENWKKIVDACADKSPIGHFAWVSVQMAEQQDIEQEYPILPLWRGHPLSGIIDGLPWLE